LSNSIGLRHADGLTKELYGKLVGAEHVQEKAGLLGLVVLEALADHFPQCWLERRIEGFADVNLK
jgi:hypothetical protein